MMKQYIFPPQNWADVSGGMLISEDAVIKALLYGKMWLFYDTCALMHHAHQECRNFLIQYIKKNHGIVILLQTIVMELASGQNGNSILSEHLGYIKEMTDSGIPVLFLPEENCSTILASVMNLDRKGRNERFTYAVRHLRNGKSGIGQVLDTFRDADRNRILSGKPVPEELGDWGVKEIRKKKQSGDSMGEEMIFYCMIMLSSLFVPMVVLSDDKSAFDRFYRTNGYIKEHYRRKEMQYYSSVHLCHIMYQQGFVLETDVETFLKKVYGVAGKISFRGITSQDIGPEEQTVSVEDMVKLICEDKELRILI